MVQICVFVNNNNKFMNNCKIMFDDHTVDQQTLISFDRKLATNDEINQLLISDSLDAYNRARLILYEGSKLQKWSLFEYVSEYLVVQKNFKPIIDLIASQTRQLNKDLQMILGYGFTCFLDNLKYTLTHREKEVLLDLTFKILKQEDPELTDQWILVFVKLVDLEPNFLETTEEYINTCFDFKASPQRRRVGLLMIRHIFERSQKIRKQTLKKLLLFNEDRNKNTRVIICSIIAKYLVKQSNNELWHIIWQYSEDPQQIVRTHAYAVLTSIYSKQNFESLLNFIQREENGAIVLGSFDELLKNFEIQLQCESVYSKLVAFCNCILLKPEVYSLNVVITVIIKISQLYQQKFLLEVIENILELDFSDKSIACSFINLYSNLDPNTVIRKELKIKLLTIFKLHNYQFSEVAHLLPKCFKYDTDCDFDIFIKFCNRFADDSNWNGLNHILPILNRFSLNKAMFDRITLLLVRLLQISPNSLLTTVSELLRHLVLVSRRKPDFVGQIRDKLICKTWVHRRNYYLAIMYIYEKCSWQIQKLLPSFNFLQMQGQKVLNIKLIFCKLICCIHQFSDPADLNTRYGIFQMEKKLKFQKQPCIVELLQSTNQQSIRSIDTNRMMYQQQNKYAMLDEEKLDTKDLNTQRASSRDVAKRSHATIKNQTKKSTIFVKQTNTRYVIKKMPKSYSMSIGKKMQLNR